MIFASGGKEKIKKKTTHYKHFINISFSILSLMEFN